MGTGSHSHDWALASPSSMISRRSPHHPHLNYITQLCVHFRRREAKRTPRSTNEDSAGCTRPPIPTERPGFDSTLLSGATCFHAALASPKCVLGQCCQCRGGMSKTSLPVLPVKRWSDKRGCEGVGSQLSTQPAVRWSRRRNKCLSSSTTSVNASASRSALTRRPRTYLEDPGLAPPVWFRQSDDGLVARR